MSTLKRKAGFTLIELLVVIAIIGILASIVLVSFPSANNKAKDTRIISAISQANKQAMEYIISNNSYTGYTITSILANDIAAKGGSASGSQLFVNNNGKAYCIQSVLNTGGYSYCIDSTGVVGKILTTSQTTCVTGCTAVGANSCACPSGMTSL